jgi:glycosyltransferase involved in cell wall biosynthesis
MKVLLVSSNSGSRGGGEIYLCRLAEGLKALGHEVFALLAAGSEMDELAAQLGDLAAVVRVDLRNTYHRSMRAFGAVLDRAQIVRLREAFTNISPDLLHLNQQVAEDGLDLLVAAREAGLPHVSTVHIGSSPRTLGAVAGGVREHLARHVMARSSALHISVSAHSAEELGAWIPVLRERDRLRVVHNGVFSASTASHESPALRDRYREEWGVAPESIVLGCVGRIEEQKDPLFLLELFARLSEDDPRLRLVWIGDGRLRGRLEDSVQAAGLTGRVTIDGWRADATQRLRALDLFVLPSRFEGLPLALLEALWVGLPCCANSTAGIPEAIVDGLNGRLCEPGDLDGWLETLGALLNDPQERSRLGAAAIESARAGFSIETMTTRTVKVYSEAIDRARLQEKTS